MSTVVVAAARRGLFGTRRRIRSCRGLKMTTSTAAKNSGTTNCASTWKNTAPINSRMASSTMNETTRGTSGS